MGGTVPADSVATGTVTITAGSTTESGTIRIQTRGTDQSAESLTTPSISRAVVYSHGDAKEMAGTVIAQPSLELAVSSQSTAFPLVFLARALADTSFGLSYLGMETVDGATANHVGLWQSFANSKLQHLAEFSKRDIWLDAASGFPIRIAYTSRAARGAVYGMPIELHFSDFRNVGGVLYPFQINKLMNGMPWGVITIQQVTFNNGLTDSNFPVQ
jgi:hypothetical protein